MKRTLVFREPLLVCLALAAATSVAYSDAIAPPAAYVNQIAISQALVKIEASTHPIVSYHGHPSAQQIAERNKECLESLIIREASFPEAKRRGLLPAPALVDQDIAVVTKRVGGEKAFEKTLEGMGATLGLYRDWATEVLAERALTRAIRAGVRVTDGDVSRYYQANVTLYVKPESARVEILYFPVAPNSSTQDTTQAGLAAEQAYHAWTSSTKDPEKVAKRFGAKYLNFGEVHRGGVVKDLEDVIFATPAGEVARPYNTIFGIYVVRVAARSPKRSLSFSEVKQVIRKTLLKMRGDEAVKAMQSKLLAAAVVKRSSSF